MTRYLIVGGDGLIGAQLEQVLARQGSVVATTRRAVGPGRIVLDLSSGQADAAYAVKADVAFICAAMTSMLGCETNPLGSHRVNVTETIRLIAQLASNGCFVVFLSSNTVFDGETPFADEDTPYSPTTEYGRQKAVAEQGIRNLPSTENCAIVRLSKVVTAKTGVAANFIQRLRTGEPCPAFADLLLCPVSLTAVCAGLSAIAAARKPGVFHLSGAEEMSYAELAGFLARRLGAAPGLVLPSQSSDAKVNVLYRPRHPALGMARTRALLGLVPEPTENMLNELLCGRDRHEKQ